MPLSISKLSKSISGKNNIHITLSEDSLRDLENALKDFVNQFLLSGAAIFRFDGQQQPCQVGYWSKPLVEPSPIQDTFIQDTFIQDALARLQFAIATQHASPIQLFDITMFDGEDVTLPYQLYGCFCHHHTKTFYYLLCWHYTILSEHQQYGMRLCAQALNQQLVATVPHATNTALRETLQRTRHQLRTPLELMLLYVDLLKATTVDSKAKEWVEHLRLTVEEMHVSLDCLTEAAVPTHQPTTLANQPNWGNHDLRQLLAQCCQGMQPWIDEKQITVTYDAQPLWLRVDDWKLKQVFQNLLSNAIAFSPIAGHITCGWQSLQSEVIIKICDDGPGLSAEDVRSFGTPFYSRRVGGTGLGVFIAKQIIAEHQGSLWAENIPGGGTQVCIILPRHPSIA